MVQSEIDRNQFRSQTGDPVHTGPSDLTETVEIRSANLLSQNIYKLLEAKCQIGTAFISLPMLRSPAAHCARPFDTLYAIIQRSTATYVHLPVITRFRVTSTGGANFKMCASIWGPIEQLTSPCMIICIFLMLGSRSRTQPRD